MNGAARNPFSSGWVQGGDEALRPPGALSYVRGSAAEPLRFITVPQLLDEAVAAHGSRDAAVFAAPQASETLSWYDLQRRSDEVAAGLLGLGIRRGNRVGVWAPTRVEWLLVQFGAARIGAVTVAIDPAAAATELAFALDHLRCRVLVLARSVAGNDGLALLKALAPELDRPAAGEPVLESRRLPNLRHVIVLDEPARRHSLPPRALAFADFVGSAGPAQRQRLPALAAALDPDDPVCVQFTRGKGSGGRSGVTLTHLGIVNNARFSALAMRLGAADRLCIPVALHRGFGMTLGVLACVASGAAMVFAGESFDPEATLAAAERHRCTALHGAPSMFAAMLASASVGERDLSRLRTGVVAGSACPAETLRDIVERLHMKEVTIGYGMAETSPLSFQSSVDDAMALRLATVGRVHPQVEAKLVDAAGRIVAIGRTGELCMRGYSVMRGYWDEPEPTAKAIDAKGWLHSGDLARLDADGYCRIVGRLPDRNARDTSK